MPIDWHVDAIIGDSSMLVIPCTPRFEKTECNVPHNQCWRTLGSLMIDESCRSDGTIDARHLPDWQRSMAHIFFRPRIDAAGFSSPRNQCCRSSLGPKDLCHVVRRVVCKDEPVHQRGSLLFAVHGILGRRFHQVGTNRGRQPEFIGTEAALSASSRAMSLDMSE